MRIYFLILGLLIALAGCEAGQERSPRQASSSGLACPKLEAASIQDGEAAAKTASLLFYSPKQRKDLKLAYEADGWAQEELASLREAGFNTSQPLVLYAHAYLQSARSQWLLDVRSHYDRMFRLDREPTTFNLMFFDWSKSAQLKYATALNQVPALGKVLGEFLERLKKLGAGYSLDKLHLIGYSLSPHILGAAGRQVGGQVAQITALDPTGVCLEQRQPGIGLRPSDAKLVVARHYDMGALGATQPLGGLDILVNGGRLQPPSPRNGGRAPPEPGSNPLLKVKSEQEAVTTYQQDRFGGSHARAQEHESYLADEECHEMAYECPSWSQFLAGECGDCQPNGDSCYYLSNLNSLQYSSRGLKVRASSYKPQTKMFIKTGSGSPGFCLHHYQAVMRMRANAAASTKQLVATTNFDFGPHLQVRFKNQTTPDRYTALVTLNRRVPQLGRVSALIDGYRKQDLDEAAQKLLNAVEGFEINYMSHPVAKERQKLSFKLCSRSGPEKFVKC